MDPVLSRGFCHNTNASMLHPFTKCFAVEKGVLVLINRFSQITQQEQMTFEEERDTRREVRCTDPNSACLFRVNRLEVHENHELQENCVPIGS